MKKGSTAAAQPLSHFSRQKLTMGLDLGDRFSYYCVLDENGELVRQQKDPHHSEGFASAYVYGFRIDGIPATLRRSQKSYSLSHSPISRLGS